MNERYDKLKGLLMELFQLDQPDLDFGIYRILHARKHEIEAFLDKTLPQQVQEALGQYWAAEKETLQKELALAKEQAISLGLDPSQVRKVQELEDRLKETAAQAVSLENEVYDHLYNFFRRYYSEGDFVSKRVYKEGVYAIPYEGEEVKLYWANSDQYYIKTSEYLRDYTFRLRPWSEDQPMRVHFKIVDAAEEEHGNVKPAEGKERVFILTKENFISIENGELVLRFEYRPATLADWLDEAPGKAKPPTQKDLIAIAVKRVFNVNDPALAPWITELQKEHILANNEKAGYSKLEAHLNRYTKRNTFDYFIHKDLGGFLRRELDFYIKNEVMRLDDIEDESAPRVEQYLSKIKVIRRIAGTIIDFLAQIENFQKKLWLKKKFVVDTQYLITVGNIPEEFYTEIAANDAQRQEWVHLFSIDEIKADMLRPGYQVPLTVDFLKANPNLVVDTKHFRPEFTAALLAAIGDLENQIDGVIVHSENFQALQLIRRKYFGRCDVIYIDPPYNTDASAIVYKNDYKDSSWLSLMENRLRAAQPLLRPTGVMCIAIDDTEFARLRCLVDDLFGRNAVLGVAAVRSNPAGRSTVQGFAEAHEYALFLGASSDAEVGRLPRTTEQLGRYSERDDIGPFEWVNFRKHGGYEATRQARPRMYYPIFAKDGRVRLPKMEWNAIKAEWELLEQPAEGEEIVWPINEAGQQMRWKWGPESFAKNVEHFIARPDRHGRTGIYMKSRVNLEGMRPLTWWDKKEYSATEYGTNLLKQMFGTISDFSFPKALPLVVDCLRAANIQKDSIVLDFFAGSGTTGHAVIQLNREDGGRRKFILAEMGNYVDTVLIPRIKKAIYAVAWKSGKPSRLPTEEEVDRSPRIIKVLRLESYEDTLNNLELQRTTAQQQLFDKLNEEVANFKKDYLLHYMLDVETRNSLLNVEAFRDPTTYKLKIKRPGSDETREVNVDLLETFNWLLGLSVHHISAPQTFHAEFTRSDDGRLGIRGHLRPDPHGLWWFRTVEGITPEGQRVLVIWRKLTDDPEKDNAVLDHWFEKQGLSTRDNEFDIIYVNGGHNLGNRLEETAGLKVRLIEEEFQRLMFETEGV